jgi:hypothetical protein
MIFHFIDAFIFATSTLDSAQYVADLQNLIVPVLHKAVSWSMKVALGIVSAQAFYALVVRFIKI